MGQEAGENGLCSNGKAANCIPDCLQAIQASLEVTRHLHWPGHWTSDPASRLSSGRHLSPLYRRHQPQVECAAGINIFSHSTLRQTIKLFKQIFLLLFSEIRTWVFLRLYYKLFLALNTRGVRVYVMQVVSWSFELEILISRSRNIDKPLDIGQSRSEDWGLLLTSQWNW